MDPARPVPTTHPPAAPLRASLALLVPLLCVVCLLLLLVAALAGGARWLLATEPGTKWLLQQLPMVQVQGLQGALLGGQWRAERLRIDWDGGRQWLLIEDLSADGLRWSWRPAATAWLGLEVDRLRARTATVHTAPGPPGPPQLPADLAPPLQLALGQAQVDALLIDALPPLRGLALQGLRLDPAPGARHAVEHFTVQTQDLDVSGSLRLANAQPYALAASAALRPLADGDRPRWAAVLQADGTAQALDVGATLRGRPLAGRVAPALDLRARLRPLAAWPLAGLSAQIQSLDLSALAPQAPATALSGRAELSGGADHTPLSVTVDVANADPGRWNEGRLPASRLTLEMHGQIDRPDRVEVKRFDLALADALRSAGSLRGSAVWSGHELTLDTLLTAVTPQRLDGRAAAMTLGGPLTARLRGLPSPDFRAAAGAPAPALAADWKLDLQGRLDAAPQPVRLQVEGSADAQRVELRRVRAESGRASAELAATLARAGRADWQLTTTGKVLDFDPLPWWAGEAGTAWRKGPHRLSGDWQLDVRVPEGAARLPALTLAQRVAGNGTLHVHDSQLAGVPLAVDIALGYTPAAVPAPARLQADLNLAGNRLHLDGRGDPTGRGDGDRWRVELQAESLASLAPLARLDPALAGWAPRRGSAILALSAAGRWPAMRSDGSLSASQLQTGPLELARASAVWRLATGVDQPQLLQLELAGAAWGGRSVDHLRADLRGTLADHRIDVSGAMPLLPPALAEQVLGIEGQTGTRAQIQGQGAWLPDGAGGGRYRARIERLVVGSWDGSAGTAPPASGWALARDVRAELQFAAGRLVAVQADPGQLQVADSLALRWDEVRVDLRGELPQIQLRADVEPFLVAPFLARAQPGMGWDGDLRLGAHLEIRAAEKMDADIVIERRAGDLHLVGSDGTQLLGLSELRLAVSAHDGVWNFSPLLRGRSIGEVSGQVRVQSTPERRWPQPAAAIQGSVQAQVTDIGIWSAWVPPGWRLSGAVRTTAGISGSFGQPLYDGSLTGSGLAARNLLQGVNISDGQVAVKLAGDTAQIEQFTLRGGDGHATLTGSARLDARPQAQLQLKADHFRVLGRVDRQVIASGTIDMTFQSDQAKIGGKVTLDEMVFDASRSDSPSLDDDVTVSRPGAPEGRSADAGAAKSPFVLALGVDVDFGSRARFKGWGIDTGLRGQLHLSSPNNRPSVTGTIDAENGTFANYGQKLVIERGIVAFSGALNNPRLDVLALRPDLDSTRVGVTITGNLLTMRVRLYSEPDMSDNDKLSWLMLGRAPDGLGRSDTALLQRAAVALFAGNGEAPTDALIKALGLDDLSLRQADTDTHETVISIGKQLSRRWYVGYERGVSATTGTWQLVYRVAQRLTVRMQSGLENALDVIWTWRFQERRADTVVRKTTLTPP